MRSFETTFAELFQLAEDDEPIVSRIEIPLIQRDYAQGRRNDEVDNIRSDFLGALHDAVTGGPPLSLDFVYGEVTGGTLHPLDGQQRLTALFLLHWYLAARTGHVSDDAARWRAFTYDTRASARDFCEQLVQMDLPALDERPSEWITDQHWFLPTWRYDPTVTSMLVVIDDLAALFAGDDLEAAWERLHAAPHAISFHLLPIADMGAPEELYIKMNSRGRPLTDFENIKALLEKAVDGCDIASERDLPGRIDGAWLDLMWPLRDYTHAVDDQYLNYLQFVTELCELRQADLEATGLSIAHRIKRAFTTGNSGSDESVRFLLDAFDVWIDELGQPIDVAAFFDTVFATQPADTGSHDTRVVVFAQEPNPNLFEVCCRHYGNEQRFGSRLKLLLYATILHRLHDTDDFRGRVRIVRNLLEASEDELRGNKLPGAVRDVERIILDGDLDGVDVLNQAQKSDEIEKRAFLARHAASSAVMLRLEDHDVLRGSLVAFELDPERIESRASMFEAVLADPDMLLDVTGAWLAVGDYHREIGTSITSYRFGPRTRSKYWRELLTGAPRDELRSLAIPLAALLDRLTEGNRPMLEELEVLRLSFVESRESEQRFDWRYHMVKYPAMRAGASGIFRSDEQQLGYLLYRLDGANLRGYSRDPYLEAIHVESGVGDSASTTTRSLRLAASELEMRSVVDGFAINPPTLDEHRGMLEEIVAGRPDVHVVDDSDGVAMVIRIPQHRRDEGVVDAIDRVQVGAEFLREAVQAGL